MTYDEFLLSKRIVAGSSGRQVDADALHPSLFAFQSAVTRWALRKGRAGLFLSTGLGKTRCQVEWARLTGERTLIVAPLGVARQTVAEAAQIGVPVTYARSQSSAGDGITITNYEMVGHFDAAAFGAVVLDESSILKSIGGKSRAQLTDLFRETPYRLCCTATPAPNDIAEIANHAEFLGIMRRVDMLASFFVHDDNGWRLKGHACEGFYRWLASWAMAVRLPSDIGFPDDGYILPPLSVEPVWVEADYVPDGQLFFTDLHGITDRMRVRRGTVADRVASAAALVNASDEQWVCWCGLNEESRALARAIRGATEVVGSDSPDAKAEALAAFQDGGYRVLVTKPSIAGFGLNLQCCARMVFVGLGDSWEQYYQCIRRCWRFGQSRPVRVCVVLSTHEDVVYSNVMRKEEEAAVMSENLVAHVREMERAELCASDGGVQPAARDEASGEGWRLLLGDSVERLAELADNSVDLTVSSPPFQHLYVYNPTERDVGNCRTPEQFRQHFAFIVDHLLRLTKPGRLAAIHVQQIAAMLERDGYIGLKDFRGDVIRLFSEHGWIYHGEVCVDRDPQAQAIRTHAKGLLFVQLRKDAAWMRPALPDHILLFRKPGENAVPVRPDLSNEEWIRWAHPVWYDVRESHTLNGHPARDNADERHICPLQLDTIARCIRLWSNPGEICCDPFAGIGSTGYVALEHGRRFLGCELKRSYWETGAAYLRDAEARAHQPTLFDG